MHHPIRIRALRLGLAACLLAGALAGLASANAPTYETTILDVYKRQRYELDGWEADDLIGTIAARDTAAGWETVIVTGDKDSLQLVTDSTRVKLVSTRMGPVSYTHLDVYKRQALDLVCAAVILVTTVYSGAEYFVKNKDVVDWSNL